ncbi:MAG: hypothetical protein RI922_721 [Bacteroidota bacterium]|jgi:UDP-2,4-diacetamido-2,4,6-trideoxy-beta-L-altropyranose hydrolase
MNTQLKIRVDASSTIGFGHLTRCCALVNLLPEMHATFFSTENLADSIGQLVSSEHSTICLKKSEDFINQVNENDLVIIDGYTYDSTYFEAIRHKGARIICIDDLADRYFPVDVIINPTPGFFASNYKALLGTQYFLGLDYALLRNSFQELAIKASIPKIKNSLFICFGGSDPLNKTEIAIKAAINSTVFSEIHVVLGKGYSHEILVDSNWGKITIHRNLQETEMATLMSQMEFGIVPTSGILLECLAAKIKPISGYYIENQQFVYAEHLKLKNFIDASDLSYTSISSAIQNINPIEPTSTIIDGKSSERLAKLVRSIEKELNYTIRLAAEADIDITFKWANDEATRKYAFSKEFIPFENHKAWFLSKISSTECLYFILCEQAKPIGSIRFDLKDNIATISYLLSPEHHGKGLGAILMKKGLEELEKHVNSKWIELVQGYVLFENFASIKLFERFGFSKETESTMYLFKKNTSKYV